ncbi:MAG: DUF1214 domain-containing protein [Proteobacteria bacterium]|nr:DUF1214 domain-containing protein [Pseudomonadota bacterium]HQR04399.1 DUF1214 domain-containing protein [Rhodocyclaceae bacterium]
MAEEESILSGRLWEEYCDTLKRAGKQLLRPETPKTALDQAEGMRYLSRLIRAGLEMMVEGADADYPVFVVPSHETIKIGADNPDNYYQTARISGQHEYRIRGQRGTVPTLNFATKKGGFEKAGSTLEGTGLLNATEMSVAPDGSFEIILSTRKPASGNWLPMEETSHMLLVRQTFNDRRNEKAATLTLERIGEASSPPPLDPARFAASLMAAGLYTERVATLFADWSRDFKSGHFNIIPLGDQKVFQTAGGDPNIQYYHGYWQLEEDEAMVIETTVPPCEFWNFQVDNYWMESLDYRYHRIHVNGHGARLNPDGSVTIVLAHRDPGVPNWLTTAGHRLGTSLFRIIGAGDRFADIRTRIVKFEDIARK